jgi:hypothetical protein
MKLQTIYLLCTSLYGVSSFSPLPSSSGRVNSKSNTNFLFFSTSSSSYEQLSSPPPTPVENVVVLKDANAVGR